MKKPMFQSRGEMIFATRQPGDLTIRAIASPERYDIVSGERETLTMPAAVEIHGRK